MIERQLDPEIIAKKKNMKKCFKELDVLQRLLFLKGPKHDQVEIGFFYTNQTHMVR
jgi:hypothetical protein